jgi:hypothetical protein
VWGVGRAHAAPECAAAYRAAARFWVARCRDPSCGYDAAMGDSRDRIESTTREFRRELNAVLDQLHEVPNDDRRELVKSLSRSLASARAVVERSPAQQTD